MKKLIATIITLVSVNAFAGQFESYINYGMEVDARNGASGPQVLLKAYNYAKADGNIQAMQAVSDKYAQVTGNALPVPRQQSTMRALTNTLDEIRRDANPHLYERSAPAPVQAPEYRCVPVLDPFQRPTGQTRCSAW